MDVHGAGAQRSDPKAGNPADFLKGRGITTVFTHLIQGGIASADKIDVTVSSLMDTWIILSNTPPGQNGGRHLAILKSRGMPHSSDERLFELTNRGAVLV